MLACSVWMPLALGVPAAVASSMRYTLTATYSADESSQGSTESCNWVTPPGAPFGDETNIYVCSVDLDETHASSSYSAESVRPFLLTMYPGPAPEFAFRAHMSGKFSQVSLDSGWSRWWLGGIGYRVCTSSSGGSASGSVSGSVSLGAGTRPRPIVDIGSGGGSFGTKTTDTLCQGRAPTLSTLPFGGIPRAQLWLKQVDLRKAYGHAFTLTDARTETGPTTNPMQRTKSRWTLRFTPVKNPPKRKRWQIEIRGRDRWSWGMFTGLRAGIDVDWAHRTTLELENGKVRSATGEVDVLTLTPFSEPAGAFTVRSTAKTPPPYRLRKAIKHGGTVELDLRSEKSSIYRVDFSMRVAGPQVLDQLRRIGVADPDQTYRTMLARGTVTDTAVPMVPYNPRLVVPLRPGVFSRETGWFDDRLPCGPHDATQQDCFLTRGGEIVTVTPAN